MPRENSFSDGSRSLTPDLYEAEAEEPLRTSVPTRTSVPHPSRPRVQIVEGIKGGVAALSAMSPRTARVGTPAGDRFRSVVKRVMSINKTRSLFTVGAIGAEPGIDPRRATANVAYSHIRQDCFIQIVDYSVTNASVGRMGNKAFVELLNNEKASEKESWAKVRWISIGGISWDVISAMAVRYQLHPLAVEDVISRRHSQTRRSKVDYYTKHLFLNVLCHTLGPSNNPFDNISVSSTSTTIASDMPSDEDLCLPRSSSPEYMSAAEEAMEPDRDNDAWSDGKIGDDEIPPPLKSPRKKQTEGFLRSRFGARPKEIDIEGTLGRGFGGKPKFVLQQHRMSWMERKKRRQEEATIEVLKKGERVNVMLSSLSIFLLRDGTVITIHPVASQEMFSPITERLRTTNTVLRTSADPSMLVQSFLDIVVDSALEIVDAYQGKILKMEQEVLLKPKISTVRSLHILSGDLIMHKRTLEPIKTLIYGLRRYDDDRASALIDSSSAEAEVSTRSKGYMSHKSKIYLADVHDHCEYILASMDMFAAITENLINFTFNTASNEMNVVMRRLTLITIVCLPLTLLTGYFGMNFTEMWSLQGSDVFFWTLALPILSVVVPIFAWHDIMAMIHYLKKKMEAQKVAQNFKQR